MKLVGRSQMEQELDEELRSHIQHRADDLERSGMRRDEAERRARVEFGGRERFKEECRDALGRRAIDTSLQDLRYGVRVLRKSPGFTVTAVLTLALAIGANAVVFGVLNGVILRPLDVPDPDSLYGIEQATRRTVSSRTMYISYPDYRDFRDRNRSFDGLAASNIDLVGLDTGDNPVRAWAYSVSGNYFDVLGIQPYLGRVFHASDENGPNSAPYIVLSYSYWHTRMHDDPAAVGRTVHVNKYPFTIIGVAPEGFRGTLMFFSPDFFVPIVNQEQLEGQNRLDVRTTTSVFMSFGRLKPGVTREQAAADLNAISADLETMYPKEHAATTITLVRPGLYGSYLGDPMRAFLGGLMALAGLILLAACANLGSLFAARASDRSREVALRLALGARRTRVLRQLLTEAILISLAGGALGLWGSVMLLGALTQWHPSPKFPISVPISPDPMVYGLAFALAIVSGLLFGIVPIRQVLRTDPYQIVKAGSIGTRGRRLTLRDILLGAQIAICGLLVTSSIVAVRGLTRSMHMNVGFDPQNAMLVDTNLSIAGYRGDFVPQMQRRMIDAMGTIPGVTSAGIIGRPPLAEGGFITPIFQDTTADLRPSNASATAMKYNVSPGYFAAARTVLLSGRDLSWHDDQQAPRVALVNRELAARLFGSDSNAIGGRFKLRDGTRVEIVGVVETGKYANLTEDPTPAVFLPLLQNPMSETWLVVRSERDPEQLAPAIRGTLHGLDAGLPVYIQTWNKQMDFAFFPARMATLALGVMGTMGAILAITGIFGMAAYSVSKRMKELGIRIALGAQSREVLGAALGRAFKLLALGSFAGLVLGVLATRVLALIVYQASPRDPVVLSGAVLVMVLLGLLATWIPAQRALSADPLMLLREE
jgi:predicted permease